jgi:hypothetical protein
LDIFQKRPALGKGCRLSKRTNEEQMLLLPEGIVKLSPGGLRVVLLIDGQRTVSDILTHLQMDQPPSLHGQIKSETISFLEGLAACRAIDLL